MHRNLLSTTLTLFVACHGLQSIASAGPWQETGDAGSLPATAQQVIGMGTLDSITGTIADDLDVDMFAIFLTGGGTFSATTVGLSAFDTKLFLFDSTGNGVYVNDDADVFTLQSTLPSGDPLTPQASGLYYLVIAGFDVDPISVGGAIFPDPIFPEGVFGPTGSGGGSPITGYLNTGDFGDYTIALTGARFLAEPAAVVPEPSSLALFALCGLGLAGYRWQRRQRCPPGSERRV